MKMLIKVYFESANGSSAEEVAIFKDEECFDACYSTLQRIAEENRLIITENYVEENEDD
jgi:hypothetical protein